MSIKNYVQGAALLLLLATVGCNSEDNKNSGSAEEQAEKENEWKYATLPVSHQAWDGLLKDHVNNEGMVDYKGMKEDEAYVPELLDKQLDDQGKTFLNTKSKNEVVSVNKAVLSPYFDWYAKDFKRGDDSVVEWVNQYSTTKLNKGADITYKEYDWSLNEQQ